ncbi:hypothetical protein [Epibacterium ulvae]|uniref:hypothetical protein n=1 Tax=Epibacterium ulvae TaxID=1156985 RepID=UPI002492FBC8|nr:hypothetical protein [Epibacterium ulvae]
MQKGIANRFAEKDEDTRFYRQFIDGCDVAFSARFLTGKINVVWMKLCIWLFEQAGEVFIGEPLDDVGLKNAFKQPATILLLGRANCQTLAGDHI